MWQYLAQGLAIILAYFPLNSSEIVCWLLIFLMQLLVSSDKKKWREVFKIKRWLKWYQEHDCFDVTCSH